MIDINIAQDSINIIHGPIGPPNNE